MCQYELRRHCLGNHHRCCWMNPKKKHRKLLMHLPLRLTSDRAYCRLNRTLTVTNCVRFYRWPFVPIVFSGDPT